jgi:hypothetical protein
MQQATVVLKQLAGSTFTGLCLPCFNITTKAKVSRPERRKTLSDVDFLDAEDAKTFFDFATQECHKTKYGWVNDITATCPGFGKKKKCQGTHKMRLSDVRTKLSLLTEKKWAALCPPCANAKGSWRGGRIEEKGYIKVWVDGPSGGAKGYAFEHRLVMENLIGRPLLDHEDVHHLNGIRNDNRPENLELWSVSHPRGQRAVDKLSWGKEIISLYEHIDFTKMAHSLSATPNTPTKTEKT